MPSQKPEGQKSTISRFCSRPSELLSSVAGAARKHCSQGLPEFLPSPRGHVCSSVKVSVSLACYTHGCCVLSSLVVFCFHHFRIATLCSVALELGSTPVMPGVEAAGDSSLQ